MRPTLDIIWRNSFLVVKRLPCTYNEPRVQEGHVFRIEDSM